MRSGVAYMSNLHAIGYPSERRSIVVRKLMAVGHTRLLPGNSTRLHSRRPSHSASHLCDRK